MSSSAARFAPVHEFADLSGLPTAPEDMAAATPEALREFLANFDAFIAGPYTQIEAASLTVAEVGRIRELAAHVEAARTALAQHEPAGDGADALAALRPVVPVEPAAPVVAADAPPAEPAVPAVAEPAADPLAASGAGLPAVPARPTAPVANRPEPIRPDTIITAGAELQNWQHGSRMTSMREIAEAFVDRRHNMGIIPEGLSDKVHVARLSTKLPESRQLSSHNGAQANGHIVESVVGGEVLRASGGLYNPVEPYYDLMTIAEALRPVKAFMPVFEADRGGIQLVPPPTLSSVGPQARTTADVVTNSTTTVTSATMRFTNADIGATITATGIPAGAVITQINSQTSVIISAAATASATVSGTVTQAGATAYVTAAADALGLTGTPGQVASSLKPCIHVTSGAAVSYQLAAITRCLEVGNFQARAWPEQVEAWLKLAIAYQARLAEVNQLNFFASNSVQVTQAQAIGAARDFVPTVIKAAAYYRNHNRMSPDAPLSMLAPAWLIDAMCADLVRGSAFDAAFWDMTKQMATAALAKAGVSVAWYVDSGTGKGQYFNSGNAQTTGALTTFPGTAVWYLFSPGSFLFLDGGTLDLGIVRDSTLNSQNNYRIFAETFEASAYVGVEALEVTSSIAVNGAGVAQVSATAGI